MESPPRTSCRPRVMSSYFSSGVDMVDGKMKAVHFHDSFITKSYLTRHLDKTSINNKYSDSEIICFPHKPDFRFRGE